MTIAVMLIKAGADPYVRAADDRTGIELALKMGHKRFVGRLKPLLRTMKLEESMAAEEEAAALAAAEAERQAQADEEFEDRRFFKQKELDKLKGKNRRKV